MVKLKKKKKLQKNRAWWYRTLMPECRRDRGPTNPVYIASKLQATQGQPCIRRSYSKTWSQKTKTLTGAFWLTGLQQFILSLSLSFKKAKAKKGRMKEGGEKRVEKWTVLRDLESWPAMVVYTHNSSSQDKAWIFKVLDHPGHFSETLSEKFCLGVCMSKVNMCVLNVASMQPGTEAQAYSLRKMKQYLNLARG